MAQPFVGEIRMAGFNFPPTGWAFCDGQVIPLSQNVALFSILGSTYGGDGLSNFALPNLQARAPMHWGAGPDLTARALGDAGGEASVTLAQSQLPAHTHQARCQTDAGGNPSPQNTVWAATASRPTDPAYVPPGSLTTMSPQAIGQTGGGQAHNNMQPFLALNFIIALQGVYPPRD